MLLRLRQICSHPSLIQEAGVAYIDTNDREKAAKPSELARAERVLGTDCVQRMKTKLREVMLEQIAAEKAVRLDLFVQCCTPLNSSTSVCRCYG